MGYNLINWENSPSKQTPINAENLNQMDENIAKAIQGTRFNFSATFTSDGVLKNTTSTEALSTGSFATSQTDIVTVFVADNVTKINSGTFSGCTSLKTIYIDNTVGNVEIVSGAIPDGVSIVYSNDDNFINVNELLASAIKSLKSSVNTNRTDWESRATSIETQHKTDVQALTDKANSIVDQANTDRQNFNKSVDEINTTLDTKENVSNKVSEITHPSLDYYPDTKAVFDYVNSKLEVPLLDIESLKSNKLDKTDFNTYMTATDKAVADNTKSIKANTTAIDKCVTDIANNSALISKNQIKVTTDKSTSIVLNDSSDCNIVDLICDEKDASIAFYRKNLFDFKIAFFNANANAKITKIDRENRTVSFVTSATNDSSGIYIRNKDGNFGTNLLLLQNKKLTLSFDIVADKEIPFLASFMKSNWNVPKTVNTAKQRLSVTDTADNIINAMTFYVNKQEANITISNIQIEVNNTATDYEDFDCQKVTLVDVDVNSLHTYYPSTTVISDSDFILNYIADPKNYIDNKFNELATAIVAHESEVN